MQKKSAKLFFLALSLFSVLFFGCSKSSGNATQDASASKSSQEKKLYIYNWSYYTPDSVIEAFSKEYGCEVILDYFASNEEMYAKLKAAGTGAGYDIIVPSGDYVSIMVGTAERKQPIQVVPFRFHRAERKVLFAIQTLGDILQIKRLTGDIPSFHSGER